MNKEKTLIVFASFVALMAIALAWINPERFMVAQNQNENLIGVVKKVDGQLKAQGSNQVSWLATKDGDPIFFKTKLYTQDETHAQYIFVDGSKLEQKASTLIRLNQQVKGNRLGKMKHKVGVDLMDGEMELKIKDSEFFDSITTAKTVIKLEDNSYVNVTSINDETKLTVFDGNAKVHRKLDSGDADEKEIEVKKGELLTTSSMGVFSKNDIQNQDPVEESITFNRVNNEEEARKQQADEAEKIAKSSSTHGRKGQGGKAKGESKFFSDDEEDFLKKIKINDFKSFLYELGKIFFL